MTGRVLQIDAATHKVVDVLLPWFVNGTLRGDELAFVKQHLSECVRCQREVEWLRELGAACVAAEQVPGASNALRNLRRQLDEPRRSNGPLARLYRLWRGAQPWSRWVIAAELAVIIVLGALLVPGTDGPALYRTLGAANPSAKMTGNLVVVFDPAITESELRRILRDVGARVVDGPTQANAYVLEVPVEQRDLAAQTLRSQRAVVLAEQLGPRSTH